MTNLVIHRNESHAITLPEPRGGDIAIRVATLDDLPFIDNLQKMHSKAVGFHPRGQIEGNIKKGNVVIAEQSALIAAGSAAVPAASDSCGRDARTPQPVGYCTFSDKYLKREELGIVYQLNVLPMKQRGLIGASLLKEVFHRAAYGCKLFCCWCAQDLEANYFWESMGFIPLAFRTGSRRSKKLGPRIHIFWQRRIREGDAETPYWFPSETGGGALKENRIVLPIPPDTHWSDAKPAVLPGWTEEHQKALEAASERTENTPRPRTRAKVKAAPAPAPPPEVHGSGMWFAPPAPPEPPKPTPEELKAQKAKEREERKRNRPRPPRTNDPKLVAAARELRDRYMEEANIAGSGLLPGACGKYDVSRQLEAAPSNFREAMKGPCFEDARLLDAA